MALTVKTNKVWRDLLTWFDIPESAQKDLDWAKDGDGFFCYRGVWYNLGQFERLRGGPLTDLGWEGGHADSFFSGVVVKISPDGDRVQVGTYCE